MLQFNLIPEQIVTHYREVASALTNLGCGPRTRAALTHKSAQTLKQYGTSHTSSQHRLIPADDLQLLRDEASKLHWALVDDPIARWFGGEGYGVAKAIRTTRYVSFDRRTLSRGPHTFLPRAIEVAENHGGFLTHGNNERFDLDEAVALVGSARFSERSRWRRAAYSLNSAGRADLIKAIGIRHGYGEHSIGQIGAEYERWRCPVKPGALSDLEASVKELAA